MGEVTADTARSLKAASAVRVRLGPLWVAMSTRNGPDAPGLSWLRAVIAVKSTPTHGVVPPLTTACAGGHQAAHPRARAIADFNDNISGHAPFVST